METAKGMRIEDRERDRGTRRVGREGSGEEKEKVSSARMSYGSGHARSFSVPSTSIPFLRFTSASLTSQQLLLVDVLVVRGLVAGDGAGDCATVEERSDLLLGHSPPPSALTSPASSGSFSSLPPIPPPSSLLLTVWTTPLPNVFSPTTCIVRFTTGTENRWREGKSVCDEEGMQRVKF